MKIKKSLLTFACAIMVALSFTACGDDWGRQDDPAGGQIYPSKQTVATYDFEYSEDKPEYSDMISHDEGCEVVKDESLASNVLHLNGKGGAKIANPFNSVKLQNGAAITFAVKIDADVAEDGTVADVDVARPLISFGSEEKNGARFYFTANGQMVYSKPGQLESLNLNENDPASVKTGILTPNEWHFVALQVSNDGYQFYVDGKKSLSGYQTSTSATSFQYKTLVEAINTLPYLYIGGEKEQTTEEDQTADETNVVSIDNVTLIRNMMEDKDWNKTVSGNGGDVSKKVYVNVGTEDCSDGFFVVKSDAFVIPEGKTFHTTFINHTSKANNWNNWVLAVTNDVQFGGDGYVEYEVLRADNYGWGTLHNADNLTCNYNWDTFKDDMDGATIDLTVERNGSDVNITAKTTTAAGVEYTMSNKLENVPEGNIRCFLTGEQSWIQIDPNETFVGNVYKSGSYLVGAADYTSGFFSEKSEMYKLDSNIPETNPFVIQFVNRTAGNGANWNNWVLCCCTTPFGSEGYFENYVLRADAYGWFGAGGNTNENSANLDFTMTQSFNFDNFVKDMSGATCYLGFTRSGNSLTMKAKETTSAGEVLPAYEFVFNSLKSGDAYIFLTQEAACLDILRVGYFPYFDKINETE